MFNLYENIRQVSAEHGYTPSGLMEAMGKPKSTLSNLKKGRVDSLSVSTLQQIADFLEEPFDKIAHGSTIEEQLFEEDRVLLHRIGKLKPEDKKYIEDLIKRLEGDND